MDWFMDTEMDGWSDSCGHKQLQGRMFGRDGARHAHSRSRAASTKKDCAVIQLSLQPRRSPRNAQIPSSLFSSHINAITPAPNQLSAPRPCRSFVYVQICQRLLLRHYTLSGAAAALYIICHINMNYVSLLRARLWIASPCGLSIPYARPRVEEC